MLLNFKSGKRTDADRKEAGYDKGKSALHTDKDAHMMQWAISLFFRRKKEDSRDNEVAASQPELSEQNKA